MDIRSVLICTGSGSGAADPVLNISNSDPADQKRPDPTGSGSATLVAMHDK